MALISVIVPVYNSEKYLAKCIDSILSQSHSQLEVILVDDGSTDRSLDICKEYERTDKRISLVSQANMGVSGARNTGLKLAKGQYIGFVDSDDYIDKTMYEELLKKHLSAYDFASCGWFYEKERGEIEDETRGEDEDLENREDILFCIFKDGGCAPNVCNKLLRADVIKENEIFFPLDLRIGEDMVMLVEYLMHCNKGYYSKKALYHYVTREESAYHKRFVKGNFDSSFKEEIEAHKRVLSFLDKGKVRRTFLVKTYYVSLRAMMYMAYAKEKDYGLEKELMSFLRKYLFLYLFSKKPLKQKIHSIIISISPRLWKAILGLKGE